MKPKHEDGLVLSGTLVASRVENGLRNDDGKPWKARINTISNGTRVFNWRESGLDPTQEYEALKIGEEVSVDVEYARTEAGITTVGGKVIPAQANGSTSSSGGKSNG